MDRVKQYEAQIVEVMQKILQRDSTCIDIGANVGAVLKEMISISPNGNHIAFEPIPYLANHLQTNYLGVEVYNYALADYSGPSDFFHVKNDSGYSGLQMRAYDIPNPDIELIEVKVEKLDSILPETKPISFIKLDIEGGEYHAILGGLRLIKHARPILVFEAGSRSTGYYNVSPEMIFELIDKRLGMSIATMDRWLDQKLPFTREQFVAQYELDYYFIAYPK